MPYSNDALGICEARDDTGAPIYSRPIAANGQLTPSAATKNVSGWSSKCKALQHFTTCNETTGKLT